SSSRIYPLSLHDALPISSWSGWCSSPNAACSGSCRERSRAMAEPLVAIRGLSKSFGGLRATDRVDLEVLDGETHALIGPNGAGRSEEHTSELQSRGHLVC